MFNVENVTKETQSGKCIKNKWLGPGKRNQLQEKNMLVPSCSGAQPIINLSESIPNQVGVNFPLILRAPAPPTKMSAPFLDHLKVAIRESGFSETGTSEICDALNVLAKYGILGTNQNGIPQTNATNNNVNGNASNTFRSTTATNSNTFNNIDKKNEPNRLNAIDAESVNIEVPENIVGAILGTNGRKLIEINQRSGAKIQISPKGVFAPGSTNRIVTIIGHPIAISNAKTLIEQNIQEKKSERAQKSLK